MTILYGTKSFKYQKPNRFEEKSNNREIGRIWQTNVYHHKQIEQRKRKRVNRLYPLACTRMGWRSGLVSRRRKLRAQTKRRTSAGIRHRSDESQVKKGRFTSRGNRGRRRSKDRQGRRGSSCTAPQTVAAPSPWPHPFRRRKREGEAAEVEVKRTRRGYRSEGTFCRGI